MPIVELVVLQSSVTSAPAFGVGGVLFTVTTTVSALLEQPVDDLVITKL